MHTRAIRWLLAGTSSVLASAVAAQGTPPPQTGNEAAAASQATAPAPAAAQDSGGVQDIVVTAQRRSENLVSVPLSISASTGAALQASGIASVTDLKFNTPGFISSSGSGYTQLYIRGIGNRIFVGANPSV